MQPGGYWLRAVSGVYTPGGITNPVPLLVIEFAGVIEIVRVPTTELPLATASQFTFAADCQFSQLTTAGGGKIIIAPIPAFPITAQMRVRVIFDNSSAGDSCDEVSWLIDDEPFSSSR